MSDGPGPKNTVDPVEYIKQGGEIDNIISHKTSILGLADWQLMNFDVLSEWKD